MHPTTQQCERRIKIDKREKEGLSRRLKEKATRRDKGHSRGLPISH